MCYNTPGDRMDRNNIDKIAQTPEDRLLLAKIWDKIAAGMNKNIPANTGFLSLREQELARLLSGFCKLCGNLSCTDIIDAALDNYEQLCMVHCRKEHILRRAEYLLNRTR